MQAEIEDRAPASICNTDEELLALKASWRAGQQWQCRQAGELWHDLPLSHRPGWFYDTQYRQKPAA